MSRQRHTYESVKQYIESKGDELLSKEYINIETKLKIKCGACLSEYLQVYHNFKRGYQHGHCPSKQRTKSRILNYDIVKAHIESTNDKLISKTYVNANAILRIKCGACCSEYDQTYARFNEGHQHGFCPAKTTGRALTKPRLLGNPITYIKLSCRQCKREFQKRKGNERVFCSEECHSKWRKTDEAVAKQKIYGRVGGLKSVKVRCPRSKNEMYMYELCCSIFQDGEVLANPQMFEGWDADIVILPLKLAVRWNGIWHYKQVRSDHCLESTQRRDRLKDKAIKRCGYTIHTVKDMGGHNKKFVEEQFEILKDILRDEYGYET